MPAIITGSVALVVGISLGAAGGSGSSGNADAVPNTTVTVTATAPAKVGQPGATVTVTARPKPAPAVTVTAKPKPAPTVTVTAKAPAVRKAAVAISDGQWVIGKEMAAGKWRTVSNAEDMGDIGLCYADVTNDNGDILAQQVANKGKTIVVIKTSYKGDTFKSQSCGDWEKIG